jgi:hypothetical protein
MVPERAVAAVEVPSPVLPEPVELAFAEAAVEAVAQPSPRRLRLRVDWEATATLS